jgi:DNA mismatch repair protein MSH6
MPDAKGDEEKDEGDVASLLEEASSPSAVSSEGASPEPIVRKPVKSKLSKYNASTPASSSPPSTSYSSPKPAIGAFGKPLDKGERAKNFQEKNKDRYSWLTDIRDKEGHRPGDENYDPRTLYIPNSAWKTFTAFERQYWYFPLLNNF